MINFITYQLKNGKTGIIKNSNSFFKLRKIMKRKDGVITIKDNVKFLEINKDIDAFKESEINLNPNTSILIKVSDKNQKYMEIRGGSVKLVINSSRNSEDKIAYSGIGGIYKLSHNSIQVFDAERVTLCGNYPDRISTICILGEDIEINTESLTAKNIFLNGKNIKINDSYFEATSSLEIRSENLSLISSIIKSDSRFKIGSSNISFSIDSLMHCNKTIKYNDYKFSNTFGCCHLDGSSFNRRFANGRLLSVFKTICNEMVESNDRLSVLKEGYEASVDKINQNLEQKVSYLEKRKVKSIFN